jgi:hypothetical protein
LVQVYSGLLSSKIGINSNNDGLYGKVAYSRFSWIFGRDAKQRTLLEFDEEQQQKAASGTVPDEIRVHFDPSRGFSDQRVQRVKMFNSREIRRGLIIAETTLSTESTTSLLLLGDGRCPFALSLTLLLVGLCLFTVSNVQFNVVGSVVVLVVLIMMTAYQT